MNRDDAVAMLAQSGLTKLTPAERAAHVETALGEGLLDDQPELAGVVDDPGNEAFDQAILDTLRLKYVGTKNEYISAQMRSLGLGEIAVEGTPELLAPCPCCKFRTLSQRGQYDICPVCGWEDTGVDDAMVYSGPNHSTLGEARGELAMKELEGSVADASDKYFRAL